jgi:hypothetical protein
MEPLSMQIVKDATAPFLLMVGLTFAVGIGVGAMIVSGRRNASREPSGEVEAVLPDSPKLAWWAHPAMVIPELIALLAAAALLPGILQGYSGDQWKLTPASEWPTFAPEKPEQSDLLANFIKGLSPIQQAFASVKAPVSKLKIAALVDRSDDTYRVGEFIELFVRTSEEAYLHVVSFETSGNVVLLQNAQRVDGNKLTQVLKFKAAGPAGTHHLKVIASKDAETIKLQDAAHFQFYKPNDSNVGSWASFDKIIRVIGSGNGSQTVEYGRSWIPTENWPHYVIHTYR